MMKTKTKIKNLETGKIITFKADLETAKILDSGEVWIPLDEFCCALNEAFPYAKYHAGPTIPAKKKEYIKALKIQVAYLKNQKRR